MGLTLQDTVSYTPSDVVGAHIRTSVDPLLSSSITPTILSNATITTNPAPTSGDVSLLVDGFFINQNNSISSILGLSFDEVLNKNLIFDNINSGNSAEIIFDLGDKFLVNNIIIYSLLDISVNIAYSSKTVFLLTSDDGINFNIPLTNVTNTNFGTQKGSLTFDTTFKRYFKLIITEVNYISTIASFDTSKLAINEIQFNYNREQDVQIDTQTYIPPDFFEHPIEYDLSEGWFMIGYPHPYAGNVKEQLYAFFEQTQNFPSITKMNEELNEYIYIIKDNAGAAYWPEFGFDGIGNFEVGQGYQIKFKGSVNGLKRRWRVFKDSTFNGSDETFQNSYGTIQKYSAELDNFEHTLSSGWNMISYNRFDGRNVPDELESVGGFGPNFEDLVIVKDYLGGVFWPTFNFNGIGDFIPGHGYQIRTNNVSITTKLFNVMTPPASGIFTYLTHPEAGEEDQTSIDNF